MRPVLFLGAFYSFPVRQRVSFRARQCIFLTSGHSMLPGTSAGLLPSPSAHLSFLLRRLLSGRSFSICFFLSLPFWNGVYVPLGGLLLPAFSAILTACSTISRFTGFSAILTAHSTISRFIGFQFSAACSCLPYISAVTSNIARSTGFSAILSACSTISRSTGFSAIVTPGRAGKRSRYGMGS